jgi:hypothetical protein
LISALIWCWTFAGAKEVSGFQNSDQRYFCTYPWRNPKKITYCLLLTQIARRSPRPQGWPTRGLGRRHERRRRRRSHSSAGPSPADRCCSSRSTSWAGVRLEAGGYQFDRSHERPARRTWEIARGPAFKIGGRVDCGLMSPMEYFWASATI